jgi:hypothetical protein
MATAMKITGELYFSDHEPRVIGHLMVGNTHYEIVGLRRSEVRTDLTGHRIELKQGDLFSDGSDERKQHDAE